MTDSLTGLVNRTQFEQRLTSVNSHKEDLNMQHVACFMDLDRFKIINDTCGHAAGDNLLQQIGELFKDKVRGNDLVAHTIVQMAQIMGMKTIAGTVDNKATLVKLQDIGVDYAQGRWFGKAAPLEDAWKKSTLAMGRKVIPLNMR